MRETLCRLTRPGLGLLLLAALLPAAAGAEPVHPAFVDAATVVPGLEVEMRYAGPHNFVGAKVTRRSSPGSGRFMERAIRLDDRTLFQVDCPQYQIPG